MDTVFTFLSLAPLMEVPYSYSGLSFPLISGCDHVNIPQFCNCYCINLRLTSRPSDYFIFGQCRNPKNSIFSSLYLCLQNLKDVKIR
ncbi:hypothetical protein Pelo_5864 [Pelomyxa schiedti]|nr:hypothetical protein Pelo_5864 [Pelomyxa schiedti]